MLKIKKFSKKELPLKLSMFRDASGGEKKSPFFVAVYLKYTVFDEDMGLIYF